jgi:hypothetical protein
MRSNDALAFIISGYTDIARGRVEGRRQARLRKTDACTKKRGENMCDEKDPQQISLTC